MLPWLSLGVSACGSSGDTSARPDQDVTSESDVATSTTSETNVSPSDSLDDSAVSDTIGSADVTQATDATQATDVSATVPSDTFLAREPLPRARVIQGVVTDLDGSSLGGATVRFGDETTTTTADGRFTLEVADARGTLRVAKRGFVTWSHAHAPSALPVSVALARASAPVSLGAAGGTVQADGARLVVPAGAFPDGTELSATTLDPALLGHGAGPVWRLGDDGAFHRIARQVVVEVATEPSMPVRVEVPLSDPTAAVALYHYDPAADAWVDGRPPVARDATTAAFEVSHFSALGVGLMQEDDGPPALPVLTGLPPGVTVGYDTAEASGQLREGDEVPIGATLTFVYDGEGHAELDSPFGDRLQLAPGARMTLDPPADPKSPAHLWRMLDGRLRMVVRELINAPSRGLHFSNVAVGVRGTAFGVELCTHPEGGTGYEVDVVEGAVEVSDPLRNEGVEAGTRASGCSGCGPSAVPGCGPPPISEGDCADGGGHLVCNDPGDVCIECPDTGLGCWPPGGECCGPRLCGGEGRDERCVACGGALQCLQPGYTCCNEKLCFGICASCGGATTCVPEGTQCCSGELCPASVTCLDCEGAMTCPSSAPAPGSRCCGIGFGGDAVVCGETQVCCDTALGPACCPEGSMCCPAPLGFACTQSCGD